MNIIITLTALDNAPVYVNANNIETFYAAENSTLITLVSGGNQSVMQTPAQVLAAIIAL